MLGLGIYVFQAFFFLFMACFRICEIANKFMRSRCRIFSVRSYTYVYEFGANIYIYVYTTYIRAHICMYTHIHAQKHLNTYNIII